MNKHPALPWLHCVLGWLFFCYEGIQISSFNALMPALMHDLHISGLQVSFLASFYFYAVILLLIPAGTLLEYCSFKFVFLGAIALSATGSLLFCNAHSLSFAVLAKTIAGIGASVALVGNLKLNTLLLPKNTLSFGIASVIMFGMLGDIIGQVPITYSINTYGWRCSIFILSLVGYLIFLINIFNLKLLTTLKQPVLKFNLKHILLDVSQVFTNRQNWLAGYFIFSFDMPVMILGTLWGETYVMQVFNFSALQGSLATTMLFLGIVIGLPSMGRYFDKTKNLKNAMKRGAVLTLSVMLILVSINQINYIALLALFFLLGLFSTVQISGYTVIARQNPEHLLSIANSFASVLVMGLGVFFRLLFSYLVQLHWDGKMQNGIAIYLNSSYRYGLMTFLVCFLLGIIVINNMQRSHL